MNIIETTDTLVFSGSEVKALDNHRVGGYLVLFSDVHSPDLTGDFFTSDTQFYISDGDSRPGFYNHGFDMKLNNRKIGDGVLTKKEAGIWLEAQLTERDAWIDAVYDMVKQNACGLSSGAISHLCRREPKTKSINWVSHWAIGEWSITPTPAEVRTLAMPLKMWADSLPKPDLEDDESSPNDAAASEMKAAVSIATVRELEQFLRDAGVSVKQAKTVASRFTLRDVEDVPVKSPPETAVIDPEARQIRELKLMQLALRTEGLRRTYA